jgi:hypothetical protein
MYSISESFDGMHALATVQIKINFFDRIMIYIDTFFFD